MSDREIILKIYNLIATQTEWESRSKTEKEIIDLINNEILLKER